MARTGNRASTRSAERRASEPHASKPSKNSRIASRLVAWYREHRRSLPWRQTRDPYAIWVSEMMLQQTQVRTVLGFYERWMQRFPTLEVLARASEDDVLHAWQGLGYYSRARRLREGARVVVERHGGRLPDSVTALRTLPGVGAYTAGAIASIAYGQPEPVVDGNVVRVLCRLFALRGDPGRAPLCAELWKLARALVPREGAADYNQALMELGATVCTPHKPRCGVCPLNRPCRARAEGIAAELPEIRSRPAPTPVHAVAALVFRRARVLVVKLPEHAPRWAGMWLFPSVEVERGETAEAAVRRAVRSLAGLDVEAAALSAVVRHGITRFKIVLDAYRCTEADRGTRRRVGRAAAWKELSELDALAMPAPHRRIARTLADRHG